MTALGEEKESKCLWRAQRTVTTQNNGENCFNEGLSLWRGNLVHNFSYSLTSSFSLDAFRKVLSRFVAFDVGTLRCVGAVGSAEDSDQAVGVVGEETVGRELLKWLKKWWLLYITLVQLEDLILHPVLYRLASKRIMTKVSSSPTNACKSVLLAANVCRDNS